MENSFAGYLSENFTSENYTHNRLEPHLQLLRAVAVFAQSDFFQAKQILTKPTHKTERGNTGKQTSGE